MPRPGGMLPVAAVLVLLLFSHGFGAEWENPLRGQPEQMQSRVDYDPKLTAPFFKSNEWSYSDGEPVVISETRKDGEDGPRKHTAKCFSTSHGVKHRVRFCKARLLDVNTVDLFIHESNPAFNDNLRVRVNNGMFTCQFSQRYQAGPEAGLTWTTKRQKLTLDKKTYRKGDVIEGKIDFEVVEELINPKYPNSSPRHIEVFGVFKTIVE